MSTGREVLPFEQGTLLAGKYRVDRLIGEGGMAHVYRVVHEPLSQPMALKVMRDDGAAHEARFIHEARVAASLRSEHVVRVFDVARLDDGRPCFAMEMLDGTDLSQVVAAGPVQPATAVDWIVQALDAVAEAHARGLVHRDLKPANLFLAKKPSGERIVKVLDFGISKKLSSDDAQSLTTTKAMMGSPLYMSPEQVRNTRNVDRRSDLWSIGVMLYELIEGKPPFLGETYGEVFAAIIEDDPRPFTAALPAGLEAVIRKCLTRDREQRPENALALAEMLAPFATNVGRNVVQKTRVAVLAEEPTGSGTFQLPAASVPVAPSSPEAVARTLAAVEQTAGAGTNKKRIVAAAGLGLLVAMGGAAIVVRREEPKPIAPAAAAAPAPGPVASAPAAAPREVAPPPPAATSVSAPATMVSTKPPPLTKRPPARPAALSKPPTSAPAREPQSEIVTDRH